MNKAEQEKIIEEVVRRIKGEKTMIEKPITTPRALVPTYMKWFRDEDGKAYNSKMTQATGDAYCSWQIWELIRRASCVCCGVQYVRQLRNEEKANEIADKICQCIYDLAMEYKHGTTTNDVGNAEKGKI